MKDVFVATNKTPIFRTWSLDYIVAVVQKMKGDCIRELILVLFYTKVVCDLCTTFLRAPHKTILTWGVR